MNSDYLVVLMTAPDMESARALACALVEKRLAACVNILPGVTSFYRWEGRLQEDAEVLLLAKTHRQRLEALQAEIRAVHPYQVPEIIALPVVAGLEAYLNWVGESVLSSHSAQE